MKRFLLALMAAAVFATGNAQTSANMKVVVIESDTNQWDMAHISVLQQNSDFLTKWVVRQYKNKDNPDFLDWERSNLFSFTRQSDHGKWERALGFKTFEPTPDVIERLKKENEELTMFDLWKMPVDEDFLKVSELVNKMSDDYRKAKNAVVNAASVVKNDIDDDIPF